MLAGVVFGSVHWSREDDARRTRQQHRSQRQLLGVAVEEELAERSCAAHQEHHGTVAANLLIIKSDIDLWTEQVILLPQLHNATNKS